MFTVDFFIDTLQSTKRGLFKQVVKDEQLQAVADRYLDAQTEFAKMIVKNTISMAKYSFEKMTPSYFPENPGRAAPYKVEPDNKQ